MARNLSSIVKQSRREGYALHPKAHKALVKRTVKPGGDPGFGRIPKPSQYALQLREKQKVKRLYGLLERQFTKLMAEASRTKGESGTTLLQFLEIRLDNVIYRSGLAVSRRAARQLVSHGHFLVNSRRTDVPSQRVQTEDKITPRPSALKTAYFKHLDELSPAPAQVPSWLKVDREKMTITVVGSPTRDDTEPDIKEQLIVEFYSR